MKPSSAEVGTAIYGAWRLMRFDSNAMSYFDKSVDGFWKSFYSAIFWVPLATLVTFLMFPIVALNLSAFIGALMANVAYLFFMPLVLLGVCNVMGWRNNYTGCIVAYNWSRVFHVSLLLLVGLIISTLLTVSGDGTSMELVTAESPDGGPSPLVALFLFGLLLYLLAYEVFIYSRSLEISIPAGFAMVLVELMIAFVWTAIHQIITSVT